MSKLKLGDICSIIKGKKIEQTDQSENSIRYIQIEDLRSDEYIKYCENKNDYVIANANDIIIAWDGANAGTIGFGLTGAIGSTLAIIRLNRNDLYPRFIGWLLRSKYNYLRSNCTGATIPHINKRSLEEIRIPLLPMETQRQIARTLDTVTELLSLYKQHLTELDNLIKSVFYNMFGDPVTNDKEWSLEKLGDVTTKIGSGATPKGGRESYHDEGITLIRSMNVHNGMFKYDDLVYLDENQAKQLDFVSVEKGDVFINITGASVARSCVVPDDVLPARVNQHVSIIRLKKDKANPEYINNVFINDSFQTLLLAISKTGGSTREAITKQQLENLIVPLPPLEKQNKFASIVTKIKEQKSLVKKAIEETQLLFDSLMSQYFDE